MDLLSITLAVVPFLLQAAILVRMAQTRAFRLYPVFAGYVAFDLASTAVTFVLWRMGPPMYAEYFFTYWTAEAIRALLGMAVAWEIYQVALRRYHGLRRVCHIAFRGGALVLLGVAILLAARYPALGPNAIVATIFVLGRSLNLVLAGLVLLLLALKAQLGIPWSHPQFGIALGFALFTTMQVVVFAVRADAGPVADAMLRLLVPLTYNLAAATWLAYFWRPAPVPVALDARASGLLLRWNRALAEAFER